MARYNANKLSYNTQDHLMYQFCKVIVSLNTETEVQNFLKDLLNRQERIMLIRRLLIAELLLEDKTYREIKEQLRVGSTTIARVDCWLHFGRGGYKLAVAVKRKKWRRNKVSSCFIACK